MRLTSVLQCVVSPRFGLAGAVRHVGLWAEVGAMTAATSALMWLCLVYGCPTLTKYGYTAKPLPD
eukprot:7828316-Pyramimonas_sp.AAC.1